MTAVLKSLTAAIYFIYFMTARQGASWEIDARSGITQADTKKRIKYGKSLQAAMGLYEEYCSASTVHGVRYFGEKKRHWLERVWWIFAFTFALYYCGTLIHNVYIKWDQSPVIVSFAEKSKHVWEIPFPAVTICPETKSTKLNFTDVYYKMKSTNPPYNIIDEDKELMTALLQICESYVTEDFEAENNFTDSSITDLLRDTAPSFNDSMYACAFRNKWKDCQEYFEEIMSEEGLCFTFNALNGSELYHNDISSDYSQVDHNMSAKYWNLENGYNTSIHIDPQTYPYRVFGSGDTVGLLALITLYEQHLEYLCRGPVQGFKVLLHTPGEVPQVSKHYFKVQLFQEVLVAIKPNMMTTSEGLRHYEPNRRQCYFESERQLRFLKVYTQRNCELECLANFTLAECGCVKFAMPRDNLTPICGAGKLACCRKAEDNLLEEQFIEGLTLDTFAEKVKSCNCLPACTSITYDAEITQAQFDWVKSFKALGYTVDELSGMQPARLSIFFRDNQFITSRRSELYGPTDFLANCGGLIGLFTGASFLSIVELLYFFSLRLCCNLRARMNRKQNNEIADCTVPEIIVVKPIFDDGKNE